MDVTHLLWTDSKRPPATRHSRIRKNPSALQFAALVFALFSKGAEMINRLSYHLPRMLHQLGRPVRFGKHHFRMPGYFPCRFTTSSDRHEHFLEVMLKEVLETRPGTFIDVGVNAGQTLAKVLGIDRARSYLGFEPQLSCCFNADQFIKTNGLANAQVLPIALSDNNQLLPFFFTGETDECASLIDRKGAVNTNTQTSNLRKNWSTAGEI